MFCQECKKRDECVELCPEAEKYVNRDYVAQRESLIAPIRDAEREIRKLNPTIDLIQLHISSHQFGELACFAPEDELGEAFAEMGLTKLQGHCLYLFYFEGLSYAEIAQKVNRGVKVVDHCIYNAKRKIRGFFSKTTGGENVI